MLISALTEPIEVHLTQDGFALTDLAGPALLAIAAVIAATLAAYTAKRNHREQLKHDRDMHREQLKHDRDMREREHSRAVLDKIIERTQEFYWRARDWDRDLIGIEGKRASLELALAEERDEEPDGTARKELQELKASMIKRALSINEGNIELNFDHIRLLLRFGEKHDIVTAHEALKEAVLEASRNSDLALTQNRSEDAKAAAVELQDAAGKTLNLFLVSCSAWLDPSAPDT